MPAVPFIAIGLGASGAFAAAGAALASVVGVASISTAAATAIGAGAFAGLTTAVQGGNASQVLKSAVLGGVTSYAGSAIAGSIANSVASSATGVSPTIAAAMGRVAGSAVAGAITSGTSALLTGKGDPIEALLKGGVTAAFTAGVGESVNAVLSKVPALANPLNNTEAAINRAVSAALGTAIVSGGDVNKIGTAVLNSFAATAGGLIGQQIRDSSSQLNSANEQFRASERAYVNNLQTQENLVNQYNSAIEPLISGKAQLDGLIAKYDDVAWKYNNWDSWVRQNYELADDFWGNSYWVGLEAENYPDALRNQAQAIESQATSLAQNLNNQYISLFGGEVTKYKTEIQPTLFNEDWQLNPYLFNREVEVPYTETVTGSLTPIKNQIDQLKSENELLEQNYVSAKTNLENAVANFSAAETTNAALVDQQLKNFTTARDQYKEQFGKEPTEEQLTSFASTGDILGTVGKLIADDRNENFAKEAGFKSYADFTAAGQVAPDEFYAKQAGWNDYAEQLKAQGMGFNTPQQYTTYQTNEQTAISQGFNNYQDLQAAGNLPANDYYAKQSGWENYAQKQEAESSGLYSPSAWTNYQTEQKNQTLATNAGFPDYKTYEQFGGDVEEYQAKEQGWANNSEKINAANTGITSPQKWQEFLSGKTEEDKIVQMLNDRGIPATPERVADVMQAWDFNPSTPNVGFTEALDKSDKLNISNARADTVQEAAALAKSLGYSNFTFGGSDYKINPQATAENPYNFFSSFSDAYKAARTDLGAGKNFEWTNPATGETKTFSTNNEKEQAVADQKRIDLMPAYTGEGAYTRTGNPGAVDTIYFDKNTGNVVQDTRVWGEDGKLISGEVKNINPNVSGSTAEKVAASIKESFGKTFDAFKYVTSGLNKGGWELLNQVGVLGGLTGLVDMDNWATRTAKEMKSVIDGYQNKEFLNDKDLMYKAIAKAGDAGIFAQAVETAKQFGVNPLQTAEFIAQQGASLLLGGGAMATARALGAGLGAQQAAAIGTMAVAQGASVADETYRDALKNNKTPEEAINAARVAWAGAALTSAVSNKFIPGALSNEAAIASQNIAKTSLTNALKGEMRAELAEETSGKIIGNLAAGNSWDADLGSTAVQALIGSGGATGLVHVATTGRPETAVLIAKDAGVSDQQINQIKNSFKGSVGTENFNVPQAKQQLSEILGASNLSPEIATQLGDLIATDAIKGTLSTNLQKAGVPANQIESLANLTATQIYNNEDIGSAFNNVSNALQASGISPLEANLITNQTLTGTDVRKTINDQFQAAGYTPTQEEINNLISQNATAKPADIVSSVSAFTGTKTPTTPTPAPAPAPTPVAPPAPTPAPTPVPTGPTIADLEAQLTEQGRALVAQLQQQGESYQKALTDVVAAQNAQAAQTQQQTGQQIADLNKSLSDKIAANEAAGLSRDAATTKAIEDVAANLGLTKDALLAQVGKSETQLRSEMQAIQTDLDQTEKAILAEVAKNEKAGMGRDEALQKAIDTVAATQKTDVATLTSQISSLGTDLGKQVSAIQTDLAQTEKDILAEVAKNEKAGMARDAALQAAINTVAAAQKKDVATLTKSISGLNTTLSKEIDAVQADLAQTEKDILAQVALNEKAGMTRDAALQKAINTVAATQKTDVATLTSKISGLGTTLGKQVAAVQADLDQTEKAILAEVAKNEAAGLSRDAALQKAINTVAAAQKTDTATLTSKLAGVQSALGKEIGTVKTELANTQKTILAEIAKNEKAGLSRDQATNKAVQDVATNLGKTKEELLGQIGETEQNLRDLYIKGQEQTTQSIAELDASTKAKFDALTKEQQDQALALAASTKDLQGSINNIAQQVVTGQQQTAQSIAELDASTKAKFDALTAEQQNQALALANSTKDLQGSINTVAENVARSEQATKEQIGGVQKGLEEKLSAQGKEFFDALRQQGVDYNTALTEATNKQNEAAAAAQKETQTQIQNTRDILAGQIAANEKAGLDRDTATNKAITDLSTRMGVDREAFLTGLGTTEERLKGEFTTGLTGLTGQISELQKQIEEQQKEEEERQKQEEERQKVEAARSLVSSARSAEQQRMAASAAAMSSLAALGSVGRGAPDEFKPLLPQFLTSKGGQTGYKGLLEDFQQQVEGRPDMPDNQVSQESQGSKDMAPYYSYGNETSLDQILGQDQESQQFAAGGLAQPLMTAGTRYGKYAAGGMPSPLMAAGGKMRVDFRSGDAVTGPGDGQSDDIPAMLADGEFVWPSDVVAALGNGSTKAGSDKLYEMMHAIRARARSTGPKDLPPPALKSPLDYLKKRNKNASKKR